MYAKYGHPSDLLKAYSSQVSLIENDTDPRDWNWSQMQHSQISERQTLSEILKKNNHISIMETKGAFCPNTFGIFNKSKLTDVTEDIKVIKKIWSFKIFLKRGKSPHFLFHNFKIFKSLKTVIFFP